MGPKSIIVSIFLNNMNFIGKANWIFNVASTERELCGDGPKDGKEVLNGGRAKQDPVPVFCPPASCMYRTLIRIQFQYFAQRSPACTVRYV